MLKSCINVKRILKKKKIYVKQKIENMSLRGNDISVIKHIFKTVLSFVIYFYKFIMKIYFFLS